MPNKFECFAPCAGAALEAGIMDHAQWIEYAAAGNSFTLESRTPGDAAAEAVQLEQGWDSQV